VATATRTCTATSTETTTSGRTVGRDITVRDADTAAGIDDSTRIKIDSTIIDVNRAVSVTAAGSSNAASLTADVRFVLASAVEFEDTNSNNKVDDGDVVINRVDLTTRTWTARTTAETDGSFVTVVLTDDEGEFVISAVVGASSYRVGSRTIPKSAARVTTEITWPFESRTSKLGFDYKIVAPAGSVMPTGVDAVDFGFTRNGVEIGTFEADTSARVAANTFDVVFQAPVDTTTADASASFAAGRTSPTIFTSSCVFDVVGAPNVIAYDPIVGGGSDDVDVTTTLPSSTGSSTSTGTTSGSNTSSGTVLPNSSSSVTSSLLVISFAVIAAIAAAL